MNSNSGENVQVINHIKKKQQAKELHCPGNSAAHQKEGMARTVSSASPAQYTQPEQPVHAGSRNQTTPGPWEHIMVTDVC